MASANVSIKIGNLAKDPETRMSNNNKAITTFRIGVTDHFSDETQWFNIVCFDKLAEACSRNLKKGRRVYVQGCDQISSWKGDDGRWNNKHEIIATQVQFLTPKNAEPAAPANFSYGGGGDDDIPF